MSGWYATLPFGLEVRKLWLRGTKSVLKDLQNSSGFAPVRLWVGVFDIKKPKLSQMVLVLETCTTWGPPPREKHSKERRRITTLLGSHHSSSPRPKPSLGREESWSRDLGKGSSLPCQLSLVVRMGYIWNRIKSKDLNTSIQSGKYRQRSKREPMSAGRKDALWLFPQNHNYSPS